jgi:hypothetical protein
MIEGAGPDPYLRLTDPDPGGPKTYGPGFGSRSPTLTGMGLALLPPPPQRSLYGIIFCSENTKKVLYNL